MTPQPPHDPTRPYPQIQPYPRHPPHRAGRGRLGPGQKAALYIGGGTLAVLLLCSGVVAALGSLTAPEQRTDAAAQTRQTQEVAAESADGAGATPLTPASTEASPTATAPAPATAGPDPTGQPVVEKKTVTETRSVPFKKRTVKDPSLAKGKTKVRTRGVAGSKKLIYEVTVTGGAETGRRLVREEMVRQPVTEVIAVGTKETRGCDPNYSGACVPIASDVDCAGGSGNGPAYVRGPVKVIGKDIYRLDHDGDGWGCE